ncbi:MAG TPA: hypothetical protein VL945_00700 [Candidatus Saccharimonadales bacterium]|nr:hypothetical protein [Candidatus Saccharimonadales bacterium]
MFPPAAYAVIIFAAFLSVAYRDIRRNPRFYLLFSCFAVLCGFACDAVLVHLGLWTPFVTPQLLSVSWLDPLTYIPYIGTAFVLGNYFARRLGQNARLMHFAFGMLTGFLIDITSIALGFYRYSFTFPLAIAGVPLAVTVAEGVAVPMVIMVLLRISENSGRPYKPA